MSQESDYIFHYPLEERGIGSSRDSLLDMIRTQLESLLSLLSLYQGGEEIKVEGFRLMNERQTIHSIFSSTAPPVRPSPSPPSSSGEKTKGAFQSIRNAELYEPRIPHIKRVLESLLSVIVLESGGKSVKVDGFRLKDLSQWLVPSAGDPAEVFDHLATRCDCDCSFCYLKGNPTSLALEQPNRKSEEEWDEVRTRLRYFSPRGRKALFPTLGSSYEILSHPHALDLLQDLRKKTDRPFRFSTNGNRLTRNFIGELDHLKPVYLYLSLNSSSPDRRREVMGVVNPETAIQSIPLLGEREIPYAVIIVPWPFPSKEEMLSDLRKTVVHAEEHGAHLVEVSLPGYTHYSPMKPLFDREEIWSSIVSEVRTLRQKIQCPLLVKPSLYE